MPEWQEAFPAVHAALAPEYRGLPLAEVEGVIGGVFGQDVTLADAEDWFKSVRQGLAGAAKAVAPVVQRALPGIASSAMSGAALWPWGMLGGAVIGGVGSAIGGGKPPGRAPGPRPGPVPGVPAAFSSIGSLSRGSGPTAAIGQLVGALGSPTVQNALAAMLLGPAGARTVPTSAGSQVPVAAVTNLLGMLAGRASAEWEMAVPSVEAETFSEVLDFAAPEVRAAWLYEQLAPIELAPDDVGAQDVEASDEGADEAWLDDAYDELEAELLGRASDEGYDDAYDEALEPENWENWSLVDG